MQSFPKPFLKTGGNRWKQTCWVHSMSSQPLFTCLCEIFQVAMGAALSDCVSKEAGLTLGPPRRYRLQGTSPTRLSGCGFLAPKPAPPPSTTGALT